MRILRLALSVLFVSVLFVACGSDGAPSSCAEKCPGVLAAHCPDGPVDQADCEGGCRAILSKCAPEFADLNDCAGAKPTYKCGSAIGVIVNGCEAQSSALDSCFTSSP